MEAEKVRYLKCINCDHRWKSNGEGFTKEEFESITEDQYEIEDCGCLLWNQEMEAITK